MTDKEALEMALVFIERVNKDGWILADFEPQMYEAIAALKERLAQPEQEPVECMCGICKLGKRTWVGLTEEEIAECFKVTPDQYLTWHIYKRIEAKLKEKNCL